MNEPQIVFLGLVERAHPQRDAGTSLIKWNILGLKLVLLVYFTPIAMNGWHLAFAVRRVAGSWDLRVRAEDGQEIAKINLATVELFTAPTVLGSESIAMLFPDGWSPVITEVEAPHIVFQQPGRYLVTAVRGDQPEETIGEFHLAIVDPLPLSTERIAAIQSDPRAMKWIRMQIGCNKCGDKLRTYAGLERSSGLEAEGYIWYGNIADEFVCGCGATTLDCRSVKRNLHGQLGHVLEPRGEQIDYGRLYEKVTISRVRDEFLRLINASPTEEQIQKFIEHNPILLHQFPAEKLFFKPPILTKFRADFGIVTPQKELVLVEIEPANLRLLKKDGDQTAGLQHAFHQVHSWLRVADDHRLAMLDSLNVGRDMVSRVRGVVIAGRNRGNDAADLHRLKGIDHGSVSLLTYDDLADSMATLAQQMTGI